MEQQFPEVGGWISTKNPPKHLKQTLQRRTPKSLHHAKKGPARLMKKVPSTKGISRLTQNSPPPRQLINETKQSSLLTYFGQQNSILKDQSKKSPTIDIDHQKELISSDEETPPIHNRFHFLDQQSFPPQSSAKGTDLDYSNLYKLEESVAANTQSVSRGFLNPSTECETSSEDSCEKSEFIFKPKTQQIPPKIGLDFLDQRENYSYLEFKRNSVTKDSNISYQRNVEERSHLYQTQSSLINVKASSLELNDLLSFQSDSRSRLQKPYNSFPLSNQSESSNNESALHLVNPVLQHLDECYENNGHSQKNYTNKHDSRVDSFNFSLGASNEPSMKESRLQIESNTRRDNSVIGKDKDTFSLSLSSADSHSLNFTDSQSLCLTGSHSISFTEVALSQNTRQSPRKILFNAEELERRQQMYKHEMGTLSFTEDS